MFLSPEDVLQTQNENKKQWLVSSISQLLMLLLSFLLQDSQHRKEVIL